MTAKTHEGAPAYEVSAEKELRRTLMSCMLWEKNFYEGGIDIADRMKALIPKVAPDVCMHLAIEARSVMNLRHAPLFVVREMARLPEHKMLVAEALYQVIQRADELAEFVALYWAEKKQPLSGQVKKGLARAFTKFNSYSLAKYNRDHAVKLRDVLFLCHAKPVDPEQEKLWKRLVDNELETPDTWEVSLSGEGSDKKAKWERLLEEKKLGAMALMRNLRNMTQSFVSEKLIRTALSEMKSDRVLPFRFLAAARYAPAYEPELEVAMFKNLEGAKKLSGKTVLLVDISGSMIHKISEKSEMLRVDAAYGLAILLREICEDVSVYSFSETAKLVPPRRGFALRDAIDKSQDHSGTYLGKALLQVKTAHPVIDRLIVITDEQSHDPVKFSGKGYVINVASYQNGVGYGPWVHIDGWSEGIVRYIQEYESAL